MFYLHAVCSVDCGSTLTYSLHAKSKYIFFLQEQTNQKDKAQII